VLIARGLANGGVVFASLRVIYPKTGSHPRIKSGASLIGIMHKGRRWLVMQAIDDIIHFIEARPDMMRLLDLVESLTLPDCWVGAGFVRNAVWDALHGSASGGDNDVDVTYFDSADARPARDAAIELRLQAAEPKARWDVKNQARMHHRNGDAPYLNTQDAVARWPETATAIAVRKSSRGIELIAPHGVDDLLGVIARPTPAFRPKTDVVARRIEAKGWRSRWPRLRVEGV
jgi:uncharacterized protein